MRDSEGNAIEYDLYYGNVIYMNNMACSVKPELYDAKLSAFLKSPLGLDFERPTTDDIKDAYKDARRPDILALHRNTSGVVVDKKEEKKTDAGSLMNIVKGKMFTPEMERKKREEDAKKGKASGDGITLNRLVDEQLKVEHQKKQIEDAKKHLEQERLDSLRTKKELEDERERHAQMIQEENERLETKKLEDQRVAEKAEELKKLNEEQLNAIEEKRKKMEEEKAFLQSEQERMAVEREKHQALLDSVPELEKRRNEVEERERQVELATQRYFADKQECDRLVEETNAEKQKIQEQYQTLLEKKNVIETHEQKLKEDKDAFENEKKAKGEELNSAFERLNEEKKQFEKAKKDHAKEVRLQEKNAKAKKNYTARMSTAVGITTASVLGCAFMGLSLYGVIPGMNPAAKAGASVLNVVSMKNDVNAGEVITAEDIEMVAITADQYAEKTGGKVLKADGTSEDNYVVLWNNANDVIGSYATDNLGKGEYLMSAEYSELKDGDAYVTMILDGVETKIPVSVTTAGTSSVKFYAIVTTADETGESRNLAIDMGALALEGRSLVDAVDSNGMSVIDDISSDKQETTETTPEKESENMPENTETGMENMPESGQTTEEK